MRVILEHTNNFSAKLIQFWMKVDSFVNNDKFEFTYNHALIEHDGVIWEANSPKVVKCLIEEHYSKSKYFKGYNSKSYYLDLNDVELKLAINYLNNQIGKKYEYFNFIFHPLKTIYDKWLGNKTDKRQYCYELVIRALNETNKYSFNPFLNPREFYNKINNL